MARKKFARVAVFLPIDKIFEYSVPSELAGEVTKGSICEVPFRDKAEHGVVLDLQEQGSYEGEYSEISRLLSPVPLSDNLIKLAEWLSESTLTPLGQVFNRMIPADLSINPRKKKVIGINATFSRVKDFVEEFGSRAPKQAALLKLLLSTDGYMTKRRLLDEARCSRSPIDSLIGKGLVREKSVPNLSDDSVWSDLTIALAKGKGSQGKARIRTNTFGVFTVPGELRSRLQVYLNCIDKLASEGSVLVLVPNTFRAEETKRLINRKLSLSCYAYHSRLSAGEISRRWQLVQSGQPDVVVGVINAIYLPFPDLRGIVVDGEGDRNYALTEQDPKGNLVDISLYRARLEDVPILLGDSSPSVSTYYASTRGKATSLTQYFFPEAAGTADLIIEDTSYLAGTRSLGNVMKERVLETISEDEPVLLIGERTRQSNVIICGDCGKVMKCPNCEVALKFTSSGHFGFCPYCGYKEELVTCPNCGGENLNFLAAGLEEVESELTDFLPSASIERFDSRTSGPYQLFQLVRKLLTGELDVLMGTWVAASYFLYHKVGLVGLLDPDLVLDWSSYRSTERFIKKVLRGLDLGGKDGTLVAQSYHPDNPVVSAVRSRQWKRIYQDELASRQRLAYPPFIDLVEVHVKATEEDEVRAIATDLKDRVAGLAGVNVVLGPVKLHPNPKSGEYELKLLVKVNYLSSFLEKLPEVLQSINRDQIRLVPVFSRFDP